MKNIGRRSHSLDFHSLDSIRLSVLCYLFKNSGSFGKNGPLLYGERYGSVPACDGKCYGLSFYNVLLINKCYDVTALNPCACPGRRAVSGKQ